MVTTPSAAEEVAPPLLLLTRYLYPLALFVFFLTSLTVWGIATAEPAKPAPPPATFVLGKTPRPAGAQVGEERKKGPGCFGRFARRWPGGNVRAKQVDERRLAPVRKAVMNWLLAGVLMTLVGNSVNVILHALAKRGWWCGEDYVVSYFAPPLPRGWMVG